MDHVTIKNAIIKSQHCQRNWDLAQSLPEDDLNLIVMAATQCPSKQNLAYYRCHFIQNRDLIEKIHECTKGFGPYTNSQIMANLVIVFEDYGDLSSDKYNQRNQQTREVIDNTSNRSGIDVDRQLDINRQQAIGVAAGYVNLVSTILGYSTGCCRCMVPNSIEKVLNLENHVQLLMGIGFKDTARNRREHHSDDFVFPTFKKQEIPIQWWN